MKATARPAKCVDTMFRAFSDRTRLRILFLLQDGKCCVGDIVNILRVEQPSASRHLAYLRKAGLVTVQKKGLWSYYALAPARELFHQKLLECMACCFSEVPELRADRARATRVKQAGGCCPAKEIPQPKEPGKPRKGAACCPGEER
jgi:ArsR family transcriptional regulator